MPENLTVSLSSSLYNGSTTQDSTTILAADTQTKVAELPYSGATDYDSLFPKGPVFDKNNDDDFQYIADIIKDYIEPIEDLTDVVYMFENGGLKEEIQYCIENGYTYSAYFLVEVLFTALFSFFDGNPDINSLYEGYENSTLFFSGAHYVEFYFNSGSSFLYVDDNDSPSSMIIKTTNSCYVDDALESGRGDTATHVLEGMNFTLSFLEYGNSHFYALYNFCMENNAYDNPKVLCDEIEYFYNETLMKPSQCSIIQDYIGINVPATLLFGLGLPIDDGTEIILTPQELFDRCKGGSKPCLLIKIRFDIADTSKVASFNGKINIILGLA